MRIAVIDTTIHGSLIGGAQTFLPALLKGMAARGHEVQLLAKGQPEARIAGPLSESGVSVEVNVWDSPGIVEDVAPRLGRWLESVKPDVFVVSTCPDIGWAVLPFLEPRVGTVSIAHADLGAYYSPLQHYARFIDRAVGVSPQICSRISSTCSMPSERVDWIPYGVNASPEPPETSLGADSGPIRLVYVGRLAEEHKRVSDLARIVQELASRGLDYSFDIVGDGPMMPALKDAMAGEVSGGRVRLWGWLQNEELVEKLRNAHVSLLVSDSEGFPIAVVEAMANGCAPVVTDIESGTRELVEDGRSGFICRVGDIEGFADKIQLLDSDRSLLAGLRTEAWKTGRNFSIESMLDNYERCFSLAASRAVESPRESNPAFPLMASCTSRYPLWLRRAKVQVKKLLGKAE